MAPSDASTHHHLLRDTQALRVQYHCIFHLYHFTLFSTPPQPYCVDFAVELAEFEMTSSASLGHRVNTQVSVLDALTAANRALRPGNVGKDTGRPRIREDKSLNHSGGRNELCFG